MVSKHNLDMTPFYGCVASTTGM